MTANTIDINDIIMAVNIIDIGADRGAFKGNELLTIGQLREKFVAFVKLSEVPKEVDPPTVVDHDFD